MSSTIPASGASPNEHEYHSSRVMELLKEATAEQHHDAERRTLQRSLVAGKLGADAYGAWLGQMYLIHQALWQEIAAKRNRHPALADIVRDEGKHVANLATDLAALGVNRDQLEPLPASTKAIAAIRSTAAESPLSLLGYNYVLEGSMNGNSYIARAMSKALPVSAIAYLDPYGPEQRPSWAAYRERMNASGFEQRDATRMVTAARGMFTFISQMSEEIVAG